MPTYSIDVPDSVVALVEANADALTFFGYDPTLPDPVGSFFYAQATQSIKGLLENAASQRAMAQAQQQVRATVAAAFTDVTPTPTPTTPTGATTA